MERLRLKTNFTKCRGGALGKMLLHRTSGLDYGGAASCKMQLLYSLDLVKWRSILQDAAPLEYLRWQCVVEQHLVRCSSTDSKA